MAAEAHDSAILAAMGADRVSASAAAVYRATIRGWVPPYQLSGNGRLHWSTRRQLELDARWRARAALGESPAWPVQHHGSPAWHLIITAYRPRLLDEDNATAACKALIDQVRYECLVDDSPWYLRLTVRQVKAPRREQRTEMELRVPREEA